MLCYALPQTAQSGFLGFGETRLAHGLSFSQGKALLRLLLHAVTLAVHQRLLKARQLDTEAVELFVLGAGGVAMLGQRGLLKQGERCAQLLTGAGGTARDLVA